MSARPRRLTLRARAKVNLHLEVGPRRPDGYHDLRTLFQEISLHDTLTLSAAPSGVSLRVSRSGLSSGPDNLVVRALESLRSALKVRSGASARLDKRIPVGAGLGGGSADAAAALRGGWALWKGRLPSTRRVPPLLRKLARRLGADVPFFLSGGTAWGAGIGEKLTPMGRVPRRWLVLVYPRVHVSTRVAYGLLDRARRPEPAEPPMNSFEAVILPKFPKIAAARRALEAAGCSGVLMSGSGSSVFGFASSRKEGERIARRLRKKPWDVFVVHTVSGGSK